MEEFIVFNENTNKFIDMELFKDQCFINSKGQVVWFSHEGIKVVESFKAFRNTELKDINDKKIYADCSIVEFEWRENLKLNTMPSEYVKGYFSYNVNTLSYRLVPLNEDSSRFSYNEIFKVSNIKIIDTIQDNRLNLIEGGNHE